MLEFGQLSGKYVTSGSRVAKPQTLKNYLFRVPYEGFLL